MFKIKQVVNLFLWFCPLFILGQSESMLPAYLPNYTYGSWVDENNTIVLIISQDYIVIRDKLFNYNNILKEEEVLNFTCVRSTDVKYISISKVNATHVFLDEGYKITQLVKLNKASTYKYPPLLIDTWYSENNEIELFEDKVSFSGKDYKIDYVVSSNNKNYYSILYNGGNYYFMYNIIDDEAGHILIADFDKQLVFQKPSIFQEHKWLFILALVLITFILGYLLIKWKIASTRKKEITKRLFLEMQLKSIRAQMNPHFLFNALSAIQNLINKGDNDSANHYLTEFSQLMRLTLDKSEKGLVPLHDELESIKKYLELECLRFPFEYKIDVDAIIDINEIEIPAMLVQPFAENAIIHGLKGKKDEKKLSISFKIKNQNLICTIIDNGVGINYTKTKIHTGLSREKYGLKLAKNRIDLINENYKTNAIIHILDVSTTDKNKTGTQVEILMPLKY